MRTFATLLAFLFFGITPVLSAETNSLIIIGEGKKAITDEMINHIKQLAKSVSGKADELWMLECYQTYGGPKVSRYVKVYCLPQASARLLRGKSFECVDGRETKFGGWDLCDKQAEEFGIITPLGHNFSTNEPLRKTFTIIGNPPNTDVIALFDAAKASTTNQDVMSIQLITPVRVCVETWGPPGGYGYTMSFEKQSGIWKEVDRMKLRQ